MQQAIALLGPEASGKTTLAKRLAHAYQTSWSPEFVRLYLEAKMLSTDATIEEQDVLPIALGQLAVENHARNTGGQLVIHDTNLLSQWVYTEYYFPHLSQALCPLLDHSRYAAYLLLPPVFDLGNDPIRDPQADRHELFDRFCQAAKASDKPYYILEEPTQTALNTIQTWINQTLHLST